MPLERLTEIGIDGKDIRLIANIYWNQTAAVRTETGTTEEFEIQRGVRQGYVIGPGFFNVYSVRIFQSLESAEGIRIGGQPITNLRYADDTVLIAGSEKQLQETLNAVNEKGKELE